MWPVAQNGSWTMNPFLGAMTAMFLITGIATTIITLLIRLFWRRGKDLEEL
jgi:hypothetical protein